MCCRGHIRLNRNSLGCFAYLLLGLSSLRKLRAFQGASPRSCKTSFGTGLLEPAGTFGNRSACGHHLINDDDGPSLPARGIGDAEYIAHVANALIACKARWGCAARCRFNTRAISTRWANRLAAELAISSDWLNPRSRGFEERKGTAISSAFQSWVKSRCRTPPAGNRPSSGAVGITLSYLSR